MAPLTSEEYTYMVMLPVSTQTKQLLLMGLQLVRTGYQNCCTTEPWATGSRGVYSTLARGACVPTECVLVYSTIYTKAKM